MICSLSLCETMWAGQGLLHIKILLKHVQRVKVVRRLLWFQDTGGKIALVSIFATAMQSLCLRPAGRGELRAALKPAKALLKLSALAGSSCRALYGAGQKQIQHCAIHQVISGTENKLQPRIPSSGLNSFE